MTMTNDIVKVAIIANINIKEINIIKDRNETLSEIVLLVIVKSESC